MTKSETIREFLKYASSRLDYIEDMLEKQAIDLSKIKELRKLKVLQSLGRDAATGSKGPINQLTELAAKNDQTGVQARAILKKLGLPVPQVKINKGTPVPISKSDRAAAESAAKAKAKEVQKAKNAKPVTPWESPSPTGVQEGTPGAIKMENSPLKDLKLENENLSFSDSSTTNSAPVFQNTEFKNYGREYTSDLNPSRPQKPTSMGSMNIPQGNLSGTYVPRTGNANIEAAFGDVAGDLGAEPVFGVKFKAPEGASTSPTATSSTSSNSIPEVPKANKNSEIGDYWNKLNDWAKANPLAFGGATAAGSGALSGGIGYGIGSSAGKSDGADTAAAYYRMREFLQQQQLRNANDSFLSRLGNVFGAGDVSNLIG